MNRHHERHEVVVIGAGQCGLAAAHDLAKRGIDFVVLEAHPRVGDNWRTRYDSLRLYSPAKYDNLPGLPMPLPRDAFPTGHQMADYLESYAAQFDLPVLTGMRVDSLRAKGAPGSGFLIAAGDATFEAAQVVIAAGFFREPHRPPFASDLDPSIVQLHSSDYRGPSQLVEGPVLVVGLGHSGADIAMEVAAAGHRTVLSGRGHGQLPWSVDSRVGRIAWPAMKFVAMNLLTLRTPIGRRMAPNIRKGGAPLLRYRRADLMKAGVELTNAHTTGVRDGRPLLADGRSLDAANVVWCTGFRPDYSWIELPILDDEGWPKQDRGVVSAAPGLYFLGLLFQSGFASMLVIGAARDAAYVVDRIAARAAQSGLPHAARAPSSMPQGRSDTG
ncbi:MAG TPA: FAD-dependent oxidoreductase [Candidatus Limnocylindria bacterium]|nr:FAD-dependent oxidoreductase [Candidatus Limnocylindria bacterium]